MVGINGLYNHETPSKTIAINIIIDIENYLAKCTLNHFLFHTDLTKCYDRCKQLLDEINCLIDDICPHSYVDDEIEHIYSGSLIKIRYCDICGKTVD